MKRKVIKQGHNTLTITLPKKWTQKNNVNPGDELELTESDREIVVSSKSKSKQQKAEVKVMKPNRLVSRHIFNLYRRGVDEISILYDDPIIIQDIYSYMPLLMGFEIISQGKNRTLIRNIMTLNESEYKNSMRRYLLMTKSLAEETLDAVSKNQVDKYCGIMELEKVQNRLYMFLCRAINKQGIVKYPTLEYMFIQRIEDIADDYKYIARYLNEIGGMKVSRPILKMLANVNKMLEHLYQFYYKYDILTGQSIINCKKRQIRHGLRLIEQVPRKEIRLVHIMNHTVVKIYEAASPVFGIHL